MQWQTAQLERIMRMEADFEYLQAMVHENPDGIIGDAELMQRVQRLSGYYQSGLWMLDFITDEQGGLPSDLKRGVLSEDGIHNLLDQIYHREDG